MIVSDGRLDGCCGEFVRYYQEGVKVVSAEPLGAIHEPRA